MQLFNIASQPEFFDNIFFLNLYEFEQVNVKSDLKYRM